MFEKDYRLLAQEGHLTRSSLLGGINSIRNANIDDSRRGLFYSGLFELSIGIERLMKIVVLLEYKINNNFQSPTNSQLKNFGHNLLDLYAKCEEIASGYELNIKVQLDSLQMEILTSLSAFAKGSRYYNLDELTSSNINVDPIAKWLCIIEEHISELRSDVLEKLQTRALKFGNVDSWQQNIDGEWITTCDFHYLLQATEKASYHVVWSIIRLLHPFYFLLKAQTRKLHAMQNTSSPDIPYMYEFFPFFLIKKKIVLRKKQWLR